MLDYYIYPGGNNTSNFDIRANTHYRLDIMIRGDAEVDTRIRAYTVEVLCTPEAALSNGFLLERQPMRLTLRLGGAYEEAGVEAFVELKTGDVRYFGFEGQWGAVARPMEIRGPENDYDIRYWPPSFTREECRFMFRVHILDRYGRSPRSVFRTATPTCFGSTPNGSTAATGKALSPRPMRYVWSKT